MGDTLAATPARVLHKLACCLTWTCHELQWCGIGFSQLPNGIGFGGQVGHYGVWLDATMDHGMSRPAATFARCVYMGCALDRFNRCRCRQQQQVIRHDCKQQLVLFCRTAATSALG